MTVREMWDPNVGWKYELFADYFSTQVLGEIASHELMEDEEAVDEIYWNGSTNGGFTLGSALSIIRNEESDSESQAFIWSDVWKVQVPQRIRLFLWLATQDRLMTNGNRFLRQITDHPRCLVCGEVEENTSHILRDCPMARVVWRKMEVPQRVYMNRASISEWISSNLTMEAGNIGKEWARVFAVTCWWLWRWRNERCFKDRPQVPVDQVSFIMVRVGEIVDAMRKDVFRTAGDHEERFVRWNFPRVGWVKLNTDGAAKGNPGQAGGGGIIRAGGRFMRCLLLIAGFFLVRRRSCLQFLRD